MIQFTPGDGERGWRDGGLAGGLGLVQAGSGWPGRPWWAFALGWLLSAVAAGWLLDRAGALGERYHRRQSEGRP